MDGQAYVTVEANESTPMLMDAGGSGSLTPLGYVVNFTRAGGISGTMGWPAGMSTPNEGDSIESIAAQVSEAVKKMPEPQDLYYLIDAVNHGCAQRL